MPLRPLTCAANRLLPAALLLLWASLLQAQQITGVWKGRIDRRKVELKIIQKGDSLTGSSYYYEAGGSYRRYSIRGYFDQNTNSAVWWDDRLIEEKKGNALLGMPGRLPQLAVADFNCPGGGEMYLEGRGGPKEEGEDPKGEVGLQKIPGTAFPDEWDYVIEEYTIGANHPDIIDSLSLLAFRPTPPRSRPPVEEAPEPTRSRPGMVVIPQPQAPAARTGPAAPAVAEKPQTIHDKLVTRSRKFVREIPVTGDSIELRFYDNAQVDGDSISLFLNNRLLHEHIRLSDKAFTVKIALSEIGEASELVMVAENLGAIPPNTSHMVAIVGAERYETKLASTENSSAMIRLKRSK